MVGSLAKIVSNIKPNNHSKLSLSESVIHLVDLFDKLFLAFRSNHACELQVQEGRLSKSVCKENHIFRPFSSGDHGATTEQEQTLVFVEQSVTSQAAPSRGKIDL